MMMSSIMSVIASTSRASAQRLLKRKGGSPLLSRPCECEAELNAIIDRLSREAIREV